VPFFYNPTQHGVLRFRSAALIAFAAAVSATAQIDREAVRREIQDFSAAGFDRRLGPDYRAFHGNGAETFPEVWMAPSRQDPGGRRYQIGGPWTSDPGAYSSTQGQVLFAPDDGEFGIDRINVLEWSNGCFSERPESPWWGGFSPDPISQKWLTQSKGHPGVPLAIARGIGGWANCGVVVFSSGLVGTAGTATALGTNPKWQLPKNKIATAVAVTSKSEFALIAVCDVRRKRGELAVFALQGGGNPPFVHDWKDRYPCLPNVAWISGMKLLGYVTLPGMEFPTAVSATGNDENPWVFGPDGNVGMLGMWDLSRQQSRDSFRKGQNRGYASTAGFAVVVSRHENKAAFIDLRPLFARVHELYFTTEENFRRTRNLGPEARQWPYTFAAEPRWKPRVVKTVDVPEPTATLASIARGEKARAYIASMDGTVRSFQVGGPANGSGISSADIEPVGETRVGKNPTCLAVQKRSRDTIIAVSRGDRELAWIYDDGTVPKTVRRLRDARLIDPVSVEMADTNGIDVSLITVVDFRGRKILNYRFSPVTFSMQGGATFGMGPAGMDEFECGGVLEFPGSPFAVSAANLN
jgi:hypothetical protein